MKRYMWLILLVMTGCAHTRVDSWEDNRMTVCGNKRAKLADLIRAAEENGCEKPKAYKGKSQILSSKRVTDSYGSEGMDGIRDYGGDRSHTMEKGGTREFCVAFTCKE